MAAVVNLRSKNQQFGLSMTGTVDQNLFNNFKPSL